MSGPYKRGAAFAVCLPAISPGRDKSLPLRIFYAFRPLYNAAQFAYNGTM